MTDVRVILLSVCLAIGLQPLAARAHEGHDDDAPSASSMLGAKVSRVEAQSDVFEIVGTVENGVLTMFLDRYATNEPVVNAKIDIDAGLLKGSAQANPDGSYTFKHATLSQPGAFPVTFTIAAGTESDLLAGELVIGDTDSANAHAGGALSRMRWWWLAGAALLLAGIAIAWWSRRTRVKGTVQ